MRALILGALLVVTPAAASAGTALPLLPVPAGAITITSPGTADLGGYRIVIAPSGEAIAVDLAGRTQRVLPADLTKALFADAAAAMPLSKLPVACPDPPVVPAPIVVAYNGETSLNVSCLTDLRGSALFSDVRAVTRALYVSNLRSRAVTLIGGGAQSSNQPAVAPVPAAPPPPAPPSGGYGGYHM